MQVAADDVGDPGFQLGGPAENLNPSVRCGCRQNRRHSRLMLSWLTVIFPDRRSRSTSRRDDQCVTPMACSDSGSEVSLTARSVSTVLRRPRGPAAAGLARAFQQRHSAATRLSSARTIRC